MTVYENIEYPADAAWRAGRRSDGARRRGAGASGADGARQVTPGSLSGGHQQLVAIARAIAGRPPIVLADEPTGNLDSASGEAVIRMLEELHAGGSTICIATHDPRYIARTTRRIYLFDGRVVPEPVS